MSQEEGPAPGCEQGHPALNLLLDHLKYLIYHDSCSGLMRHVLQDNIAFTGLVLTVIVLRAYVLSAAPLQEMQYWQSRKHVCLSLNNQLQQSTVRKAVDIFLDRSTDRGLTNSFEAQMEALKRVK